MAGFGGTDTSPESGGIIRIFWQDPQRIFDPGLNEETSNLALQAGQATIFRGKTLSPAVASTYEKGEM
jgi:hypothetical protein